MYILFICIVAPLMLMLFLLKKKAQLTVGFMIVGIFLCLFVSEINAILRAAIPWSIYSITTTVTPITEEIVKAIPVVFFAFVFTDKRETLLSISMAVGIGFAILENAYILTGSLGSVDFFWALTRGFGSGLVHGICTVAVGLGISFIRKRKKLFYTGTFALLTAAIIYHATYNALVQSAFRYAGFLLPLATYIPLVVWYFRRLRQKEQD